MKYWVYMKGEVPGSFAPKDLTGLAGFSPSTLVCPAEGEIMEKNWRHAGEFSEIMQAVKERESTNAAAIARPASPDSMSLDRVHEMLEGSSNRLFRHVMDLMKELQDRREDQSASQSLQRVIAELKDQLQKTREDAALNESRAGRVPELEQSLQQARLEIKSLQASLKNAEEGLGESRIKAETSRSELENAKRKLAEATSDLTIRNRLVEKLSHEVSEKELALAKALVVIGRFEEELGRLCPSPAVQSRQEQREPEASLPAAAAPEPEALPIKLPDSPPAAQGALVGFVKKYLNEDFHH